MITINVPKSEDKGLINNQKESWNFKFDKILHNVSQEEVFEYCTKEIIQKSIEGYNGTVFAYGQTGSGKTFSMSGSPNNYNYRGIVPRSITRTFQEIGGKPEYEFIIKISYLEIYNETLLDLLSPIPTHEQKGEITLQEDRGNLIVKGLTTHLVNNEEEAFNLVFEGEANRTISEHQLNKNSTRSHCVFTIYLEMKSRIESSEKVITSKLNFVDLAGSERVKKTGSTGITLKEANYINKSLTFLEQVVVALTDKTKKSSKLKDHIPYRQSKLTHILKDSIGGNCRTVMIATVWPEEPYLFESLSTLNFAKRMMNVMNEASVNIQLDTNALLRKYQKEIKELKQELAMHNTLSNRGRINYDTYTPEEQYQQQVVAKRFLIGQTDDIEFESVRQAKELFHQCRYLFRNYTAGREIGNNVADINKFNNQNLNANLSKKMSQLYDEGVGVLEVKSSFGIGFAARDARPVNKLEVSNQNINQGLSENEEEKNDKFIKENEIKYSEEKVEQDIIPDKNSAFQIYKSESSQAKEIESGILQCSEELKKRKLEAKEYLNQNNSFKLQMENLKNKLSEKKLNKLNLGDDMTELIDEEGYKLIDDLKNAKNNYKEYHDKFKFSKSEINSLKSNLDMLKVKYVESFESWFLKKYGIKLEEHELKLSKNKYGYTMDDDDRNRQVEPEEQAYFNAKKKVESIHKAKKLEKKK